MTKSLAILVAFAGGATSFGAMIVLDAASYELLAVVAPQIFAKWIIVSGATND